MPILNYTTKVPIHKTLNEIQQALAEAGARSINIEYDRLGQPEVVSFSVEFKGRYINFRLPSRWQGVQKRLKEEAEPRYQTEEQAQRVAWRIVKDWVKAQMAIIDAELATMPEVFLPYAMRPDGKTLYEAFEEGGLFLPEPE